MLEKLKVNFLVPYLVVIKWSAECVTGCQLKFMPNVQAYIIEMNGLVSTLSRSTEPESTNLIYNFMSEAITSN